MEIVRTAPAPNTTTARLRPRGPSGADVLLIVAVSVGAACAYDMTARWYNLAALLVGGVALLVTLLRGRVAAVSVPALITAATVGLGTQALTPPAANVTTTPWFWPSVGLGLGAVTGLGASLVAWRGGRHRAARVLLGTAVTALAAALILVVPGGRTPRIDVWVIFQQAATDWVHGRNPYDQGFSGVPLGQTATCFNYLPASFLALTPGKALGGDVRVAEITTMVVGWTALGYAIRRTTRGRPRDAYVPLCTLLVAATLPGTLVVAQQAWNESLVLGLLLLTAALLTLGRPGWAWVPLALALATKQHVALLLPVLIAWPLLGARRTAQAVALAGAICLPFVVADADRFRYCTVDFFVHLPARDDSLSLWRAVPSSVGAVAVVVTLLLFTGVAMRRLPRTPGGLLLACGTALFGFDVLNKQSFENQWWLVCELLVCGLALRALEHARGEYGPEVRQTERQAA